MANYEKQQKQLTRQAEFVRGCKEKLDKAQAALQEHSQLANDALRADQDAVHSLLAVMGPQPEQYDELDPSTPRPEGATAAGKRKRHAGGHIADDVTNIMDNEAGTTDTDSRVALVDDTERIDMLFQNTRFVDVIKRVLA